MKAEINNEQTYHRLFLLFLCVFLLPCMASGCGESNLADTNRPNMTASANDDDTGMGRYTETITDLPDNLSGSISRLFKLNDDSLVLTNTNSPFLISKDSGTSWLPDERSWHTHLLNNGAYIMDIAIGSDNTAAVIYEPDISNSNTGNLLPKLLLIDHDGTEIPVTVDPTHNKQYLNKVFITDNGRIFVTSFMQGSFNIYEVYKDGSSRLFLAMDEKSPDQLLLSDHRMILYGAEYDYPLIYDVISEKYLEDTVLSDFIDSHTVSMSSSTESKKPSYNADWYLFADPQGSIYLAGQEGLYRHIIGGNAIEQIIDGKLSVLNNPSYNIAGIILFNNHEFLAVFHNRKLVCFTYDPDIPTKPSEVLKVYSLENNDTIRQAITLFLADNPDVYIEYNIGMTGDNTITREDALKKLNTEIMAGDGPDVLIMDDLPYVSYVEKGLLKDLTPTISIINNKEPLFTNIPNAMKSDDGKIYALPCEMQLPVLLGDQPVISQMNNLENLADTIDTLRRGHPGQDLLGIYTAEDILHLFALVSAPSWTEDNKAINTQNISSFLKQTKRLYDAQNENFTDEPPEIYVVGTQRNNSDTSLNLKVIEYVGGYVPSFTCGVLYNSHTYAELISSNRISGFESCGWRTMNGQNNHVFIAKTLIGISSTAHNPECAEDFLQICMSADNQSNLYNGLPINRAALNDIFALNKDSSASNETTLDNQPYDSEFLADSEGHLISIDIYQPDKEAVAILCTCIENADTPYIADKELEDVIYEQGSSYIHGEISLDEAVYSIEQKLTIYMAE